MKILDHLKKFGRLKFRKVSLFGFTWDFVPPNTVQQLGVDQIKKHGFELDNTTWAAFKDAFNRNRDAKQNIAKYLAKKLGGRLKLGSKIYFGPGTTVYDVFTYMYKNQHITHQGSPILTSNKAIDAEASFNGLEVELIGNKVLLEYPSLYYSDENLDSMEFRFNYSIIGLAGMDIQNPIISCKTCFSEQTATVKKIFYETDGIVYLIGDCTKISSSAGHVFIEIKSVLHSSQKAREVRFVIGYSNECNHQLFAAKVKELNTILGDCNHYQDCNIYEWILEKGK